MPTLSGWSGGGSAAIPLCSAGGRACPCGRRAKWWLRRPWWRVHCHHHRRRLPRLSAAVRRSVGAGDAVAGVWRQGMVGICCLVQRALPSALPAPAHLGAAGCDSQPQRAPTRWCIAHGLERRWRVICGRSVGDGATVARPMAMRGRPAGSARAAQSAGGVVVSAQPQRLAVAVPQSHRQRWIVAVHWPPPRHFRTSNTLRLAPVPAPE